MQHENLTANKLSIDFRNPQPTALISTWIKSIVFCVPKEKKAICTKWGDGVLWNRSQVYKGKMIRLRSWLFVSEFFMRASAIRSSGARQPFLKESTIRFAARNFSLVILVNWPSIRLMPYFRVADKLHEQIAKNTSSRLPNWYLLKELVTGQRVFVAVRKRTREILQPALSLCLGAHGYELC